jgi:hypothetical protein
MPAKRIGSPLQMARRCLVAVLFLGLFAFDTLEAQSREGSELPLQPQLLSELSMFSLTCLGEGFPEVPAKLNDSVHCVFVFIASDCPISNRFAPELRRLHEFCRERSCAFYVVYAEPDKELESLKKHALDFELSSFAIWDKGLQLAKACGARRVPEAVVVQNGVTDRLVYRGRIDDRYIAFGKMRPQPTRYDVREAIETVASNSDMPFTETAAIGCIIPYPSIPHHLQLDTR